MKKNPFIASMTPGTQFRIASQSLNKPNQPMIEVAATIMEVSETGFTFVIQDHAGSVSTICWPNKRELTITSDKTAMVKYPGLLYYYKLINTQFNAS